jgi:hypothetical protein
MTARPFGVGSPSTGTVRGSPLLAPVVVSITTGIPDSRFARVWRPLVALNTGRSMWCRVRTKSHEPGPLAAKLLIAR